MCGICGIVNESETGPLERAVRAMCETLRRRGPDEDGYYFGARASLGMRRLSIIDLSTGRQPMGNEDGKVKVVFNGEIYNYRALKIGLESKGHRFKTSSDTEVIPHLYEEYGDAFVHHLNGMFGIALWDRGKKKLLLYRDRLGIKPLYYSARRGRLIFGSEMKAILAAPGVDSQIDFQCLNQYLTYEYVPPPGTIISGINKLGPGEMLIYSGGRCKVERYWDLPRAADFTMSEDDAAERLMELIEDAVRLRLIADVPVGSFLSGGLDSTCIASVATRFSPNIKSFSVGFEEPSFDESEYARRAAAAIGTDHRQEMLSPGTMAGILPEVLGYLDEPLSDPSLIPTSLLSRFTRRHVTVALSGDGADELFGGYQTYQAHKFFPYFRALPSFVRKALAAAVAMMPVSEKNLTPVYMLGKFLNGMNYDTVARHFVWLGPFAPHEKSGVLSAEIYDKVKNNNIFSLPEESLGSNMQSMSDLDKSLFLDVRYFLAENMLAKVDRASMMHSLEVRTPMLDHRIVEFVCTLPAGFKLRGLKTKYLLKKAVAGVVPPFVLARKKKGFGIPLTAWIKKDLKEEILDTLSADRLGRDGLFRPDAVRGILERHVAGHEDNRKKIWNLFVLLKCMDQWDNYTVNT